MELLNLAAEVARAQRKNRKDRTFFFGAVGVRKDGLIVQSTNLSAKEVSPPSHAEARLCKLLASGATVYVARVLADGTWAMAKPCPRCESRLRNKRVKRVYYTISDREYGVLELA